MTTRTHRRASLASLGAAAALLVMLGWAAGAPPARAADVHGNEEHDRYVGTGGLILPGSIDHDTRVVVATCQDCHWRLATPCLTSPAGSPFEGQSPCLSVSRGCGNGQQLLRAWFQEGEVAWREIGLVCIGEAPITVVGLGREVREGFVHDLVPPIVRRQPPVGVVTQLPVIFDSGQHGGAVRREFEIAGERVGLTAVPAWRWEFGDGSALSTIDPGGRFPHGAVAHAYRHAGGYRVRMTTVWSATFTVAGLGPFDVPEPVTQSSVLTLPVGEGRAVLSVR